MARNVIEFSIKGIDRFSGAMKKFTSSLKSIGSAAISMTKWVAGTATALVGFVSVVASGIDQTAKFSSRIGVAVDQLSRMQFAANQAGLSNTQFNLSVQRMTRRVAEATQGMGEAQGALRELGINAKQFQQLGVEDQFTELADRLNAVEAPADRLRLAFKLFDSEGTAVLQMLNQGSEAMRAMAKDAEFLGLVISKQAAADAEHFNDSMGRATGSIKGVSRAISGELMPVLSGLANGFADSLARSRGSIVSFVKNAVVGFFTFMEVVDQVFSRIYSIFTDRRAFSAFLDSMGEFVKTALISLWQLAKAMPEVIWEGVKAMISILNGFGTWLGESMANWVRGKPAADFSDAITNTVADAFSRASANISEITAGPLEEFKAGAVDAASIMGEAFGINLDIAGEKARETLAGLMEFGQVAKDTIQSTAEAASEFLVQFDIAYQTWKGNMENSSKEFAESFFNLMSTVIDEVSNKMADAIIEGKSMSDAFKGFAQQVLKQLVAMLIKMGIQRLIVSQTIKAGVASEASAEGGKAVGLAAANGVASWSAAPWPINIGAPAFGAAMGAAAAGQLSAGIATGSGIGATVGAREHGGPVGAGQQFLVGEAGPELFVPRSNGSIIPNDQLGGKSVVIENLTINIALPELDTAEALREMDEDDWEEVVAGPVIVAMDSLFRKGIKLSFLED